MLFSGLALLLWLRLAGRAWRMPGRILLVLAAGGVALGVDFMCWHRSIHLVGPGLATLLGISRSSLWRSPASGGC